MGVGWRSPVPRRLMGVAVWVRDYIPGRDGDGEMFKQRL